MGMAADNLECYENLANAIILQAVKDYKTVLFRLEDHPNNRDAQFEKKEAGRFLSLQLVQHADGSGCLHTHFRCAGKSEG